MCRHIYKGVVKGDTHDSVCTSASVGERLGARVGEIVGSEAGLCELMNVR